MLTDSILLQELCSLYAFQFKHKHWFKHFSSGISPEPYKVIGLLINIAIPTRRVNFLFTSLLTLLQAGDFCSLRLFDYSSVGLYFFSGLNRLTMFFICFTGAFLKLKVIFHQDILLFENFSEVLFTPNGSHGIAVSG